ncbi:hypothetical protein BSR29_03055 [Boudabousia liubingyangii]|uniref:Uncharacterized protein n=2 Tax=Boudabousia TaxID=2767318 RepID=A0A1D9MLA4_9ACTO|nr:MULTISPECIES: DUF1617 family protein [Boudabousia]AOZ73077.1 hypothetical protein BK816_07060 [Boudabousia tangfeifanii]OKL47016.1 hypothetical protein BSR28_06255 [Boudabousia liubingyangii]OKL48849.1 hypothetical protein BSR29_03055 [Boudabousia liubingyangii]
MPTLKIPNHTLPAVTGLLDGLELAGAASRARTKLHTALLTHLEALGASEVELARQYATLDETGEIVLDEAGGFTLKDPSQSSEFAGEHGALMNETVAVPSLYEEQYRVLAKALADYPGTFKGPDATAYDLLCDALEQATVKEGA